MAARNVRCTVVESHAENDPPLRSYEAPARELLPWADPYIVKLARALEAEGRRRERQRERQSRADRLRRVRSAAMSIS